MIEDFYIRDKANESKKVLLRNPDGTMSEEWLMVLSQWSDAFMINKDRILQEAVSFSDLPDKEKEIKVNESKIKMLVPLVVGWSFDKECNATSVYDLLLNAPQIKDKVYDMVTDDAFFFGSGLKSSTSGLKKK